MEPKSSTIFPIVPFQPFEERPIVKWDLVLEIDQWKLAAVQITGAREVKEIR
jgi:hypothetical protein